MTAYPPGCDGPHGHPPHHHAVEDIDGVDPLSSRVLSALRSVMHLNRQFVLRMSGGDKSGGFGRANLLRVLGKHEGISQRELAELLHLSPPTVTALLQKMEQSGLVERWNDGADQRITRIRRTAEGRAEGEALTAAYAEYVNATVGSLPEGDRSELARLLGALADTTASALKDLGEHPVGAPAAPISHGEDVETR